MIDDFPGEQFVAPALPHTPEIRVAGAFAHSLHPGASVNGNFVDERAGPPITARQNGLHIGPFGQIKMDSDIGDLPQCLLNPLCPLFELLHPSEPDPLERREGFWHKTVDAQSDSSQAPGPTADLQNMMLDAFGQFNHGLEILLALSGKADHEIQLQIEDADPGQLLDGGVDLLRG